MLSLLEKSTWHTAFLSQSCSLLQSRIQSQSQPVTKETDEKLLYIHTPVYISDSSAVSAPSLSFSHTYTHPYTQSWLSLSPTQTSHTLWLWQQQPSPSYTLLTNLSPPPLHCCRWKSQLSCFPRLSICLSVHVWLCVCNQKLVKQQV